MLVTVSFFTLFVSFSYFDICFAAARYNLNHAIRDTIYEWGWWVRSFL